MASEVLRQTAPDKGFGVGVVRVDVIADGLFEISDVVCALRLICCRTGACKRHVVSCMARRCSGRGRAAGR